MAQLSILNFPGLDLLEFSLIQPHSFPNRMSTRDSTTHLPPQQGPYSRSIPIGHDNRKEELDGTEYQASNLVDLDTRPDLHTSLDGSSNKTEDDIVCSEQMDGSSASKHMPGSRPRKCGSFRNKMWHLKESIKGKHEDSEGQTSSNSVGTMGDRIPMAFLSPRPTVGVARIGPAPIPPMERRHISTTHESSGRSEIQAAQFSPGASDVSETERRSSVSDPITTASVSSHSSRSQSLADAHAARESEHVTPNGSPGRGRETKAKEGGSSIYFTPRGTPVSSSKMNKRSHN